MFDNPFTLRCFRAFDIIRADAGWSQHLKNAHDGPEYTLEQMRDSMACDGINMGKPNHFGLMWFSLMRVRTIIDVEVFSAIRHHHGGRLVVSTSQCAHDGPKYTLEQMRSSMACDGINMGKPIIWVWGGLA